MHISKKVLVPFGHSAIEILPLMLSMLAQSKAPASGAAGIPVLKLKLRRFYQQEDNILGLYLILIL